MNSKPLVSVIIPAYNAQDFIGETINSIFSQTYKNLEVVVVDDGSTDQTARVVTGYGPRVRYYYQNNSGGCGVPRNAGIANSSGELLCFIDADDLIVQDRVSRQVDFMERHPEVGLVFSDYRNFDKSGQHAKSHFETCPTLWSQLRGREDLILEDPCRFLAQENFGIAGSFLMRRSILKFEPCFDPTLKSCEDFHFFYRLARNTRVGLINEVGMMRRLHGNNMTANPLKMLTEGVRSRSLLLIGEKDPITRKHLNRYIFNCSVELARFDADNGRFHQSLGHTLGALRGPLLWPETGRVLRSILRTVLIAVGVFRPRNDYT